MALLQVYLLSSSCDALWFRLNSEIESISLSLGTLTSAQEVDLEQVFKMETVPLVFITVVFTGLYLYIFQIRGWNILHASHFDESQFISVILFSSFDPKGFFPCRSHEDVTMDSLHCISFILKYSSQWLMMF